MVAIVTVATLACQPSQLSRDDVRMAAGDLRSIAAASSLLLEQVSAGGTTSQFFSSQTDLLLSKARDNAKQLEGMAGKVELQRGRLREAADALAADLERLQTARAPSPEIKTHIDTLIDTAKTIEEQLKE
jgi:hypothetical protein